MKQRRSHHRRYLNRRSPFDSYTTVLEVVAVTFRERNKWRFSQGGNTFYAEITDEDLDLSRFRGRLSVWVACCRRMAIRSAVVDMMDPFAAWGPSEGEETAHGAAARGRCLVASLQNRVYGPGAAGKVSQHPPNRRCVRLTRLTHAVARSSWVSVDPAQNGAGADCTSLR